MRRSSALPLVFLAIWTLPVAVNAGNQGFCAMPVSVFSGASLDGRGVWSLRQLWEKGEVLDIAFLDGDPMQREVVERCAREWEKYANVRFHFRQQVGPDRSADIAVTFQGEGCHSLIGTASREAVRAGTASMTLSWINPSRPPEVWRQTVLHEFGHALGLEHEHQSPAADFRWNVAAIHADCARTQGWDREKTELNVLRRLSSSIYNHTVYDPASIMVYSFGPEWTLDGSSSSTNYELSATDKQTIASLYPGLPGTTTVTIRPTRPPRVRRSPAPGEKPTYMTTYPPD